MTTTPRFSALLLAAVALPLAAQTPTPKPVTTTASHTASVHHTAAGCARLPEISPKIPAVPADAPCAKVLYTLTKTPDTRLDYASPLVSPEVKATLGGGPTTFSIDYIDTKVGTGELAKPGKFYTVHYTGYLAKDGAKFDSSVDRGEPISFPYGGHRVIPGWDTGFEGMRVGGKRRLFIPYQLAYGEAGHPPVIPSKSELVFDVEFIAQGDTAPTPKPNPKRTPPARPVPSQPMPGGAAPAATPPAATPAPATTAPSTTPTTPSASGTTPPPASTPPPTSTTPPSKPQ